MHSTTRWIGLGLLGLSGIAAAQSSSSAVLVTTDPLEVEAFAAEVDLEDFEGIGGTGFESYAAGQTIDPASRFNSRDSAVFPTFNSGGGSPDDPVGNPGAPIGIMRPEGAIAGDVESGENVAAPLVIFTDEPFNGSFIEVIFPEPVERVGFWITHGEASITLRDDTGADLTTGDVNVAGVDGEFIGIQRDVADISVAAIFPENGADAFTIDDFVSGTETPVPEPAAGALLVVGALVLGIGRAQRIRS